MNEKLKLRCITKDRRPSSQQVNRWIRFVIDSKDCPTNAQTRFNDFCRVFDESYRLKENLSNDEESQPKKKKRKLNESQPLSDLIIARHFGRAPEDGPFIEVAFFEKNDNTLTEVKLCPNHGCPCKNDFQIKVVSTLDRDAHSSPGKTSGRDPPSPTDLHTTSFLHIALQLNCTVRCFGKKKGTDYALLVGINLCQPERVCLMTEAIPLLSSSQSTRLNSDGTQTSPNQKTEQDNDYSSDASDNPRTQSQELDDVDTSVIVVRRTKEQDQDLAILMLPECWKCFIEGKTKKALHISEYVFEIFSDYFSSPMLDAASIVPFKTNAKLRYFYDHQLVFAILLKSYLFFKIGRSTDAVNAFKISSFPVLFDPNETSFTDYLFMLATVYTITGDWQKMRQSAKHGLYIVQNLAQTHGENQKLSQARLLAAFGAGCAYQRCYTEGLKYLHDSIQVIRTTTTPFSKGLEMFSMCMMAYCYGLIGNFKLALQALEEAIALDTQHFSEPKADILMVQSRLWAYQGKALVAKNFVTETLALFDFESKRDQFYNVYITAGANNLIAILRAILYIMSQPSNAAIQFSNEIRQEIFSDLNTTAILSLTNQEHGGLIYALMYDVQIVCERSHVNELLVLQMLRDAASEFPKTNGYAAALDARFAYLTSGSHYNTNGHNDVTLAPKNLNL